MLKSEKRGAKAIRTLHKAARLEQPSREGALVTVLNREKAKNARAEAAELMKPAGKLVRGAGEVAHWPPQDLEYTSERGILFDTLLHPNMISVEAAEDRMEIAQAAGVLQGALDAAQSAAAENSLEKMLCHQMAAAHHAAMKLLMWASNTRHPPIETVRLMNAAARMMQAYQEAFVTLQKVRTGGKQTVVVQHVQVGEGGQAVVAGSVATGPRVPERSDEE